MKNEKITINADMAERIFRAREDKGITQPKLAEDVDLSEITIKRIEGCRKGREYKATIYSIQKIVDVLGISLEYVMGDLYTENREKWNSIIDRWKRIQDSGDHWITFSGSGWNGTLDDMKITCNDYPVDQLIFAICDQGGRNLILDSLKRYDESKNCQN